MSRRGKLRHHRDMVTLSLILNWEVRDQKYFVVRSIYDQSLLIDFITSFHNIFFFFFFFFFQNNVKCIMEPVSMVSSKRRDTS